jgi:cytochrome c-type biogenesis protein CcmH
MSFLFWGFAVAMLLAAVAFIAVPMKTGKSFFASPGAIIVAVIPLSAIGLYALLGSPQEISTVRKASPFVESSLGSVASMVDGLRARLDEAPDDADGWILLARSYQHLDRQAEALDAYRHAQTLGKTDENLETSLLGSTLSAQMTTNDAGLSIRGRVALSSRARAQVQSGDTLFIFAKESREHRMPVVALRKTVTDLPFEFSLTDNEIMVPGSHLADYETLLVTAKISRTGNASDDSLGLEAWSEPVSPGSNDRIELVIGGRSE